MAELSTTRREVILTPWFKVIFIMVAIFAVACKLLAWYISFEAQPTELQVKLFEECLASWKMGFGAILGLMGGKGL